MKIFGKHRFMEQLQADDAVVLSAFKNTDPTKFLTTDATGLLKLAVPGGGGGGFIEITYDAMVDLMDAGELQPGSWYLMTDFATNHMIKEITAAGVVDTSEENIGPVDPLLMFAVTEATILNNYVYSINTGHRVIYQHLGGQPQLPPGSVYKGSILRRIDERQDISIPMDWLNVKWKMNGDYYSTFQDPSVAANIYFGNGQYNLAIPIIFYQSPSYLYANISVQQPQYYFVTNRMQNVSVHIGSVCNVNLVIENVQHCYIYAYVRDVIYSGVANAVVIRNITGMGIASQITGFTIADLVKFNDTFLYGIFTDTSQKGIYVDATNTVKVKA